MVEIKQHVSGPSALQARKLTQPEMIERRNMTQATLLGLKLVGELDVSDGLIVVISGVAVSHTIIEGTVNDPKIVKEGLLHLKEVPALAAAEADTSTDMRVELALQRLELAAEMGGVLSFSKHDDLVLAVQRANIGGPTCQVRVSLKKQARRAHKEFWTQLSFRAERKVAVIGGVELSDVSASREFQPCFMYWLAPEGKSAATSSSSAQSPQSAAAGATLAPNLRSS